MTRITGAPLALLRDWLPPNTEQERPQMQVATVDSDGRPDLRTVLLSSWDEHGFAFHTDSASRKAAQLAGNSAVALVVLWPAFSRQLVIRGAAEVQDRESLDAAYESRSPYLRQLAWQNTTELAQEVRDARVSAWERFGAEHDPATLAAPGTWTGYLVRPDRLTFWRSDPNGPSHRVEYRASGARSWTEHHLAG